MSLVLDSSVTLAWLYSDEVTPAIEQVFDTILADRAWVPSLWRLEVANALQMSVRCGRISAEFREASLSDLALLAIEIDLETDTFAWSATLRLAERYQLTLYDAAYLELAQRLALLLATLDQELRTAGNALGLTLLGS